MSDWRPSSPAAVARRRAEMLQRARAYFADQQVLAVDTPALSVFAGTDPGIETLTVRSASHNRQFLHTSPEFSMKRLLADGYPDIYSICRVFRDGEVGKQHATEFTMLEWYRRGFELGDIIADTTALIAECLEQPTLHDDAVILNYSDAFSDITGVDVVDAEIDQLADAVSADAAMHQSIGDDRDVWLDLLLATVVAPTFIANGLTVLQHFPVSQAALARACPADDKLADRFEVFHGATELANGYVELTDVDEQRRRFDQDLYKRKIAGKTVWPPDIWLLDALECGLPECAGVAVGIERLQMIYEKTDNIANVVTFSSRNIHE